MDLTTAADFLNMAIAEMDISSTPGTDIAVEALKTALDAIEYRIPEKEQLWRGGFTMCPNCGRDVLPTKYCSNCGKALQRRKEYEV